MDALSLLKFWKSNKSKVAGDGVDCDGDNPTVVDSTFSDPLTELSDGDYDDDDDSFFELELTLPKFDSKSSPFIQSDLSSGKTEPKITSKPQSPSSILRSASPKLRIFMFGKLNKKTPKNDDVFYDNDSVSSSCFSPKSNNSVSPFTVKFKIEDGSIVPKFTRTESSIQLPSPKIDRRSSDDSKRFSKDAVQKYLNFVKPLYSKKSSAAADSGGGGERFTVACSPTRSSSATVPSPRKVKEEKQSSSSNRFKVITKQLGKSKSASAMVVVSPAAARNDNPSDGIEGAILHCKRSLHATTTATTTTRGKSSLSRCSSDPSHEKSITVSEEEM